MSAWISFLSSKNPLLIGFALACIVGSSVYVATTADCTGNIESIREDRDSEVIRLQEQVDDLREEMRYNADNLAEELRDCNRRNVELWEILINKLGEGALPAVQREHPG